MRLRNLHRRARPFRYASFWALAAICLLLIDTGRAAHQIAVAAALCAGWPLVADRLAARFLQRSEAGERGAVALHLAEAVLAGVAFTWVSLPPAPALAVAVALCAGLTAQGGWRLLLAAMAAAGCGVLVTAPFVAVWTTDSTPAADATAGLVVLILAIAFAELGFRQAQRLYARGLRIAGHAADLESLTGRLESYLPPSVRARAREPAPPKRRERRWLTVVFVDLVGFTELAARVDAEPLAAMLDEYLVAVCGLAERHGGEVVKVLGDGVLIAFGLDARNDRRLLVAGAAELCGGMRVLVAALERRWRARGDLIELGTRAGIASGHCTVGDWGSADHLEFTVIGTPVNRASRLQAHAAVDGVLLDASSAALAEGAFAVGEPRPLELKGLGAVTAYRLAGQR
jgi:adenylate cyclase